MGYEKKLYELRQRLSGTFPRFPKNYCAEATSLVCAEMGLDGVAGFFITSDAKLFHCWNYDHNSDSYVDLTADQFDPTLSPVLVIHRGSKESRRMYVVVETEKGKLPSIGTIMPSLRATLPPPIFYRTHESSNWSDYKEKDKNYIKMKVLCLLNSVF